MELGYDISPLEHINSTSESLLPNIDFTDPKITEIAEHLYYDDYKVFNYPMST
jgi:hypothetical protein